MVASRMMVVAAVLALCGACYSYEVIKVDTVKAPPEKPAMELGGYVTVDYLSPLDDMSKPDFGIGEVDLGANVNISDEVVASVVIQTWNRLDSLWIDQALVSYKPSALPMELLFGQQTVNHGLLSTRMISDPMILDVVPDMELKAPGVVLTGAWDYFTAGFGFTVLSKDSLRLNLINGQVDSVDFKCYSGLLNIDVPIMKTSLVRLSSLIYSGYTDIDCAANITWSKFVFDAEGVYVASALNDAQKISGIYAGVQCNPVDRFGVALRYDAIFDDKNNALASRLGVGATITIKDGIFAAVEFGHDIPAEGNATQTIAFEIGLEQKIELPGFQRKTLTRE